MKRIRLIERRFKAAEPFLQGAPSWLGWRAWDVVASGAATLPQVLREWSLIDVWDHYYQTAFARVMAE